MSGYVEPPSTQRGQPVSLRIPAIAFALLLPFQVLAADPTITAVSKEVVSSYSWGYKVGVKQQHGSYTNGRSLHAVSRRSGTTGEQGNPDFLLWVDEHTGQVAALEHPVAYAEIGKNPATSAVFTSDAPENEHGRIWWVLGGRADTQPFDLARSRSLFDPGAFDVVLNDFVTEGDSTTPCLAAVGQTGLLAYRRLCSGCAKGEVRFQSYSLASSVPILNADIAIGRANGTSGPGSITIEQVVSRWDPRHRRFAVSWQWYGHPNGVGQSPVYFGSNPFIYTADYGETWELADGSQAALPLTYATATPTSTPYDHLALGETTDWLPRDLGFSPSGSPWLTMPTGQRPPSSDGWRLSFFRWNQAAWERHDLSSDMQGGADGACGATRDYLVCAYSEYGKAGELLVRVSRDDGQSWSAPVTVDTVPQTPEGSLQRISWVSFVQPADRYLDNSARFFVGYYRESDSAGMLYGNSLRWVRVQVGPQADFNGDQGVDGSDLDDFAAAYSAGDWRADFNDDGVVDDLDLVAFNAAWDEGEPVAHADLIVSALSGPPTVTPGESIALTETTRNVAPVAADDSSTHFYWSHDKVPGDDVGLAERAVPQLDAGESSGPASTLVTIPAAGPGIYYILAVADGASAVVENSESNNVTAWKVTIGTPAPSFTLAPTALAFGSQPLNVYSTAQVVTVQNTGALDLPISSISLSGSNPGQFSLTKTCGTSLPVGTSCSISVRFRPTSTGSKAANLNVAGGGGAGTKTATLTGTGVRAVVSVTPTSLAFGNVPVGATRTRSVTISNSGSVALPISSISLSGTNAGQFKVTHDCGASLAIGATCIANVAFKPTSRGSKTATLKVACGGGAGTKSVALSGTGA